MDREEQDPGLALGLLSLFYGAGSSSPDVRAHNSRLLQLPYLLQSGLAGGKAVGGMALT